jgi:hypothetical protein
MARTFLDGEWRLFKEAARKPGVFTDSLHLLRTQSSGNIGQGAAAFMARAAFRAMCFLQVAEPFASSSVRIPLSPPLILNGVLS